MICTPLVKTAVMRVGSCRCLLFVHAQFVRRLRFALQPTATFLHISLYFSVCKRCGTCARKQLFAGVGPSFTKWMTRVMHLKMGYRECTVTPSFADSQQLSLLSLTPPIYRAAVYFPAQIPDSAVEV